MDYIERAWLRTFFLDNFTAKADATDECFQWWILSFLPFAAVMLDELAVFDFFAVMFADKFVHEIFGLLSAVLFGKFVVIVSLFFGLSLRMFAVDAVDVSTVVGMIVVYGGMYFKKR